MDRVYGVEIGLKTTASLFPILRSDIFNVIKSSMLDKQTNSSEMGGVIYQENSPSVHANKDASSKIICPNVTKSKSFPIHVPIQVSEKGAVCPAELLRHFESILCFLLLLLYLLQPLPLIACCIYSPPSKCCPLRSLLIFSPFTLNLFPLVLDSPILGKEIIRRG